MNLFILDRQPVVAAQYNNDSHVRKIILEAVAMMGFAYDHGSFDPLPWLHFSKVSRRHYNHPMSKWVRASRQNFDWTLQHTQGLCAEFILRSKKGKPHSYQEKVEWIAANIPLKNLSDIGQTDWPRCFGEWRETVGVTDDAVFDYRNYYLKAKRHIATWTKRQEPFWWH